MVSKLQQRRESTGWTKSELSELSGISLTSITKIENGTSEFKTHIGVALALADALDCAMHDLFEPDDLSDLGRPPRTGTPISVDNREHRRAEMICPDCFMLVPADVGCEFCGTPVPIT